MTIRLITHIAEMQQEAQRLFRQGGSIALVPTMGYLHEGHLSLLREGRKRAQVLVLSIFVNPIQFGPAEDLEHYPRDLDRDLRLAESSGVDVVFAPEPGAMYGPDFETYVDLLRLPAHLCGLSRPGHFRGVATVVTKLFNIVKPQVALFGQKDYQQLAIIRRMARDLNLDVQIVGLPIVREPDGLAMSSRNTYLSDMERLAALSLYKGLQLAQKMVSDGIRQTEALIEETASFIVAHDGIRKDYVVVCDPETLEDLDRLEQPALMALAFWVGKTRLIDNTILVPPGS